MLVCHTDRSPWISLNSYVSFIFYRSFAEMVGMGAKRVVGKI